MFKLVVHCDFANVFEERSCTNRGVGKIVTYQLLYSAYDFLFFFTVGQDYLLAFWKSKS